MHASTRSRHGTGIHFYVATNDAMVLFPPLPPAPPKGPKNHLNYDRVFSDCMSPKHQLQALQIWQMNIKT